MMRIAGSFAICLALAGQGAAQPVATAQADGAVLRGLDKVVGQSRDIVLRVGESTVFDRLTITLTECRVPLDNPTSDAFAHIVIHDTLRPEGAVFRGWMIASSPALNAVDHARFDIWLIRCTSS